MQACTYQSRFLGTMAPTAIFLAVLFWMMGGQVAHAAVSNWQNGFHVVPRSPSDLGSDSFKQSMRDLRADGLNSVSFVVPYYQSTIYSTDVAPGYNTPTDAALASAIDYAHSLGLSVTLTMHVETGDGNWRALINPSDRQQWFASYGNALVHVAQIAREHHAEMVIIGAELQSMTVSNGNSTNTQNWNNLIARVRAVYDGKLTYSALADEKSLIAFWSQLDYVGLSVYYNNPNTPDNSAPALMGLWDRWNTIDMGPFSQTVSKPILITEIGYRSIAGAHQDPWNWVRTGVEDQHEQANAYQAFIQYWNNYNYIVGTYWWSWSPDPNAGGGGNIDYTPQHKQAEQVLKNWMFNPQPPTNPPSLNMTTDVWWPIDGVSVSGLQPFKTMVENIPTSQYQTWWQVDGDRLNPMYDSTQDYPHKEAMVEFSGWHWRGNGPYVVNFVSKNASGAVISQKSVSIYVF